MGNWDFHIIGLLEVLWKTVTGNMNRCLMMEIQFQDTIHCFCTGRGMGNDSLESNLLQELMAIR